MSGGAISIPEMDAARAIGELYAAQGRRVVFVVNESRALMTHRATWITSLLSAGAWVGVVANDDRFADQFREMGCEFWITDIPRETQSRRAVPQTWISLSRYIRKVRATDVVLIGSAAGVCGALAIVALRGTRFYVLVTGEGRATQRAPFSASSIATRSVVYYARRSDRCEVIKQTEAQSGDRVILGTGIDVDAWYRPRAVDGKLVVGFASRLIKEKGVREFVDLAEFARRETDDDLVFELAGEPDYGTASSLSQDEVSALRESATVTYLGRSDNMPVTLGRFDVLVFPSTHPEGTPRALIEACAAGLVVIASDQPGCRAVVTDGETGFIRDVRDPEWVSKVTSLLKYLIEQPEERVAMGIRAHEKMLAEFDLTSVLAEVMVAMRIPRVISKSEAGTAGEVA